MKIIYRKICSIEKNICGTLLCIILALSFLTAVMRCINHPLSWTNDISQLLLAWLAFLGADMAMREGKALGVDILTRKLDSKVRALIKFATDILILIMLVLFVRYGFALCVSNFKRTYEALGLSYSYATAALPTCSVLMVSTLLCEMVDQIQIIRGKEKQEE